MTERNLLIITIYIICVLYVFYRAIKSVEEQGTITLNKELLNIQLEAQNLTDIVNIKFPLEKRYKLDALHNLPIIIENKSLDYSIYIDWDRSSLTDFNRRSRRVIRIIPGMTLDLFQYQVGSAINMDKILKENLTTEDVFSRDPQTGALKISGLLFDLSLLKRSSFANKTIFDDFISTNISLNFSLQIVFRLFEAGIPKVGDRTYIITCDFIVKKLPWIETISYRK